MKNFICKKCGNTTYIMQEKLNGTGKAIGLYCAKCGTMHKWLNKQEKVLYSTQSAEIDYVADKDKQIASLTAENARLREEVDNLSHENDELEYKTEWFEAAAAELKKRLENAVELPCKVGDTIYEVLISYTREWVVMKIVFVKDGYFVQCGHKGTDDFMVVSNNEYGEWWFTDRFEAEARLAELKGGRE